MDSSYQAMTKKDAVEVRDHLYEGMQKPAENATHSMFQQLLYVQYEVLICLIEIREEIAAQRSI